MKYSDIKRYSKVYSVPDRIAVFVSHPGYRFVCLLRWCNQYSKYNPVGFIARIWFKNLQVKYGFQIPHKTRIGNGLFLGHYGNIVINQSVELGENCNIAQGVTLGYVSRGDKKGSPQIGSRVWIGANAVVVGNISIGDDVLIAPLSFINFDIPARAVVAGNPAKVLSYDSSEGYVNNMI